MWNQTLFFSFTESVSERFKRGNYFKLYSSFMLGKFLMILPQKSCATLFFFTCRQVYSGIGAAASFTAWRCSLNFGTCCRFEITDNINEKPKIVNLSISCKFYFRCTSGEHLLLWFFVWTNWINFCGNEVTCHREILLLSVFMSLWHFRKLNGS